MCEAVPTGFLAPHDTLHSAARARRSGGARGARGARQAGQRAAGHGAPRTWPLVAFSASFCAFQSSSLRRRSSAASSAELMAGSSIAGLQASARPRRGRPVPCAAGCLLRGTIQGEARGRVLCRESAGTGLLLLPLDLDLITAPGAHAQSNELKMS